MTLEGLKHRIVLLKGKVMSFIWMRQIMKNKECRYGPFRGEFGHLLGHILPFVSYLHSIGIKVDFCGMEIYEPFFVDESGQSIVRSYKPLRDYFSESKPKSNISVEPDDVKEVSQRFLRESRMDSIPFWDISDDDYYFYSFRWWILKNKFMRTYDLSKVYKTKDEKSCVIFPRKKKKTELSVKNNGDDWDYCEVAKAVSPYFDKVYVIGHPAFSHSLNSFDNVEVSIANDNKFILEKCSNAKLIISQHSGTVYLGEYTKTQVLIIYRGGKK